MLACKTRRVSASERGYDVRWRRYRVLFLSDHPECTECGRLAEVVDHVIPHRGDFDLFLDPGNHQALCKRCHDRKTRSEQTGRE
jgi:5-methylcytosine-specific restriction protein A